MLEPVPLRLFVGVRAAWKRAPELLVPNAPDTPDLLRDTSWLIRAEAGRPIPEADRLRLLDGLARQASRAHAVPRSFDRVDLEDPLLWHAADWFATRSARGASNPPWCRALTRQGRPHDLHPRALRKSQGVEKSFLFDAETRVLPIGMGHAGRLHGYCLGGFLESQ